MSSAGVAGTANFWRLEAIFISSGGGRWGGGFTVSFRPSRQVGGNGSAPSDGHLK